MGDPTNRILLTGGSGFIGGHLCAALQRAGHTPVVLDLLKPATPGVEFHRGDVSDLDGRHAALLDDVRAIYHLAWTTKPQSATDAPVADAQSNLIVGLRLLDALARRTNAPRLIFMSSGGAIYGETAAESISEDHPTFPLNAYGVSKLAFEHYLRLYHHIHGLDYLVFRPSNPYGERQDPNGSQGAVAVFLGHIARGDAITIWGDGSVIRDYLYVGDLADALVCALGYMPGAGPRVFNVGSGRGVSLRELIKAIEHLTGRSSRVTFTEGRKTDAPRVVLDVTRMAHTMGWKPATSLDAGIARTWKWVEANIQPSST